MSFFLVLIALSCGVNNFVQEELFSFTIFTLKGNLRQKSRNPPEAISILRISVDTIPERVLYRSRYQHTKFCTCMKNRTIFTISRHTNMEHLRETEIGSMKQRFVISERLLRQIKSKGNEEPLVRCIPCSI